MKPLISFALMSALALGATACSAQNAAPSTQAAKYDGQELAGSAKVSLEAATAIALKARPGQLVDTELEKEGGGSGLRYSFVIKSQGADYEVGVDAANGAILENQAEGAHPD